MMAEITSLKETMETWKHIFREELGMENVDNDNEEVDVAQLRVKVAVMKKENAALTSSLVGNQAILNALRKEMKHLKGSVLPGTRKVNQMLVDPGLARQFRHMESEVEQGREMMKVSQTHTHTRTYTHAHTHTERGGCAWRRKKPNACAPPFSQKRTNVY